MTIGSDRREYSHASEQVRWKCILATCKGSLPPSPADSGVSDVESSSSGAGSAEELKARLQPPQPAPFHTPFLPFYQPHQIASSLQHHVATHPRPPDPIRRRTRELVRDDHCYHVFNHQVPADIGQLDEELRREIRTQNITSIVMRAACCVTDRSYWTELSPPPCTPLYTCTLLLLINNASSMDPKFCDYSAVDMTIRQQRHLFAAGVRCASRPSCVSAAAKRFDSSTITYLGVATLVASELNAPRP
ncbi:transcription factor E74 isoform B [Danaus plexippus plexippus]|uniref:Transcription factor E74 isoform B n=1 Tax=Danaus plexippus plexippus TaxID=278856 RepID=A0A212F5E5_DANPL|nr:transcription factor E74 isoform B [Danaus plexippus plexippus]